MGAETLTEFLLARIAEDEAVASYAETRGAPTDDDFGGWWLGHYDHANRHNPARILAECEAKRRIVERNRGRVERGLPQATADVLDLASVYADHPDYRDEWRK